MNKIISKFNNYFKNRDNYIRTLKLREYRYIPKGNIEGLKVHIVNYDEGGWILSKFANEMKENLQRMGVEATVGPKPDENADINHHIIYTSAALKIGSNSTIMITHVDCEEKVATIRKQISSGAFGICMSKEVMDRLVACGIARDKLCYINPAQDAVIKPKKFNIGITHRCYTSDFRKRDDTIIDVCKELSPDFFKVTIMGSGWDEIVEQLRAIDIEVEYYKDFDKERYNELMRNFDFFYYDGTDEGNMGYLDALAAGVKTVVTPQGYHLDIGPATHYCSTVDEFVTVFNSYAEERMKICNSVRNYTWDNYTYKHLEVWLYLLRRASLADLLRNRTLYNDGIFSCLLCDIKESRKLLGII